MSFTPADPVTLGVFIAILLSVIAMVTAGLRQSGYSTFGIATGLVLWCGSFSAAAAGGLLEADPAHGLPLFLLTTIVGGLLAGLSPIGRRVAQTQPIFLLVAFHGFRFPLEMVLHQWAAQGVVPETMTWTGQNFDIVSGIAALILAPVAARRPQTAWLFNILGFTLLVNVVRVVVMSSPLPFAWDVHPKMLLALHFPYVLIAPVCVAGALAGHVVLTRRLLNR